MLNEELEHLLQGEEFGLILMDGEKDHSKRGLHLGMFVELIQDNIGNLVPPQLNHDPHPIAV